MRVSIYNDGDHSIRVIADRKAGNETMIDAGEEVVVEAESVVHLLEIDGGNSEKSVKDDDHDEDLEP
jgi:acyl CoA:acetate/3-ketoacid CoA transferase alpha subunit